MSVDCILMETKKFSKIFKKRVLSSLYDFITKYILIIPYKSKKFSRITIYPIEKSPMLKLTIQSKNENDLICFLQNLSEQLNNKIIHSTGLIKKSNDFCQTLYIEDEKKRLEEIIQLNNNSIRDLELNTKIEWITIKKKLFQKI